jgi:hypothetical protein
MAVTLAKGVQWSTSFPYPPDFLNVDPITQGQTESVKTSSLSSVSIDSSKPVRNLPEYPAAAVKKALDHTRTHTRPHVETLTASIYSMQEAKHGSRLIPVSLRPDDEGWRTFVASLAEPPWSFNGEHVSAVTKLWDDLQARLGHPLPLPLTQPTTAGNIQLAWDQGRHYTEIDILPDEHIEWFYRDRETNELDGTEEESESTISEALIRRLRLTVSR